MVATIALILLAMAPTLGAIDGIVLYPNGRPASGATITATTACDGDRVRLLTTTTSDQNGYFSLQPPEAACSQLLIQAEMKQDLWLQTGAWLELYETNGTAPIIDLFGRFPHPLVLSLGERGAEIRFRAVDKSTGVSMPARAAIRRCGVDPQAGWEMNTDTVTDDGAEATWIVPPGSYCFTLTSVYHQAGDLYPKASTCLPVVLRRGHRHELIIPFDLEEMEQRWKYVPVECP